MAVVENEPTTMDEAQRITLKTILIEEASYSMSDAWKNILQPCSGSSPDWTIVYLIEVIIVPDTNCEETVH
ncbi:hypothetical protein T03_6613 [Trichinella britovi]|uniref:Uncharacterized protein n=2 Tax=Trichinella britovi TaxID=45882 RepID=A0A0V1C3D8_TRIBR|nr:hypothetical protein T03_6613 [Trichinella britovi]